MEFEGVKSFHLFFIPIIFVLIFPKSPLLSHLIFHFDSSSLILSLISLCFSHLGDLVVAHSSSWICWQMSVVLFDCLLLCTFFLVYFIFPKKHTSHLSHCICMDTERNKQSFQTVLSAVLPLEKKKYRFFAEDTMSNYFFTKNWNWNECKVWFISRHEKVKMKKLFRKFSEHPITLKIKIYIVLWNNLIQTRRWRR